MTLGQLSEFGADVDDGLKRCMNNEEFYLRMIAMALADPSFESLGAALEAGDLDKAFDEAHKLKGVVGNLSLSPIYDPLATLTELLRHRTEGDYAALYSAVVDRKNALAALI